METMPQRKSGTPKVRLTISTLQLRVNRRTKRLGRLIDGEQATEADVVDQLRQIATRQARIQKATYDLATGRNR